MPHCKIRSFQARVGEVPQSWFIVDAEDRVLGRLATQVATVLMGKHKPTYTPHVDTGDFVIITNAEKVKLTGMKAETMIYPSYSYYHSGYKEVSADRVRALHPERIVIEAIRRMLPKNGLARHMLKKLKVYAGTVHPHAAQQAQPWPF
jgi:large subunit ribosomal protein L13